MPRYDAADFDQSRFFKGPEAEKELKKLRKSHYDHSVKEVTKEKMQDGSEKLTVWPNEDKRGLVLSSKKNLRAFREALDDNTDDWVGASYEMFTEIAFNPSTKSDGPACRVRNVNGSAKSHKKAAKKPSKK